MDHGVLTAFCGRGRGGFARERGRWEAGELHVSFGWGLERQGDSLRAVRFISKLRGRFGVFVLLDEFEDGCELYGCAVAGDDPDAEVLGHGYVEEVIFLVEGCIEHIVSAIC